MFLHCLVFLLLFISNINSQWGEKKKGCKINSEYSNHVNNNPFSIFAYRLISPITPFWLPLLLLFLPKSKCVNYLFTSSLLRK
jgi:hypothetical protein